MNEELEKRLIDIRKITEKISNLKQLLAEEQKETLEAILACDAFNKARQNAIDNIGVSNAAVLQEVSFMKDAVSIFGSKIISEDAKADKAHASVILNEYKYFDYWIGNPRLKEVKLPEETVKVLKLNILDVDLPVRITNVLRALDIYYIFEILLADPREIRRCRNFGANSMKLLVDFLLSKKLNIGMYIRFDEQSKEYRTLVL